MICVAYGTRTNTDWNMEYKCKKSMKTKKLFANFSYYKLKAGEHFIHYVLGLGREGYRVGGVKEILDQALMIPRVFDGWKTIGKKSKLVAKAGLRSSQRHGSTVTNAMKSDLSNMVWNVVQVDHQNGAPSIDESRRVLRS